jgi:hypothetical protein
MPASCDTHGKPLKEARLTDEAHARDPGKIPTHRTVNHAQDEYVSRQEPWVHTNTVEGFFGIKRGMKAYISIAASGLAPLFAEFDFRYTNRTVGTMKPAINWRARSRQALVLRQPVKDAGAPGAAS